MKTQSFTTHHEYLASAPAPARAMLKALRSAIRAAAPDAEEVISYNVLAFRLHGILCYYAAFKEHVSFFPGSGSAVDQFKEELKNYKTSKGTIQFPFGKKIPLALVKRIVRMRVKQNLAKAAAKGIKKG
jgi:uncharacterized protein YdhG (YjbR/CyaY superfamily)